MPAKPENIIYKADESFFIGIFQDNLEEITWHYHDSYELSFITEGTGRRIVADSIEDFQPGDLVFIGRNLPHIWVADKKPGALTARTLEMVFLQFTRETLTQHLLSLPEFRYVDKALSSSEKGIHIMGETLNKVSEIMLQLPYMNNFDRMLNFFRMMDIIGRSDENKQLASDDYLKGRVTSGNRRIEVIHKYIMENYHEDIDLARLAEKVNMAEGSLCRFFRKQTGLTVFEYLNRIKVDFACNLLMDYSLSIAEVCFDSGFNNISHFNKQFRIFTGATPSEYRKRFQNI